MNIFRKQKFLLISILCDIIFAYYSLLLKFDLRVAILIIIFETGYMACLFIMQKENKNEQKNKERDD